ncbi:MAG: YggS family pyridoxal phosphate-dependent enzyme [Verrucomicrobia bacterium]|nr:YggS family pyridoxal phosphate-dependent enzyme [Verrucomicrobiota bacterium]
MSDISANLELIQGQIAAAAAKSGRTPDSVQLLAVSKTYPSEIVRQAFLARQIRFGENRVQEVLDKAPQLPPEIEWHLIGHLQKNKTRKVLPLCAWIHSVDSLKLAEAINRIAGELNLKANVYLQVNISDDEAKFGFSPAEIRQSLTPLANLQHLHIEGLMTIPEFSADVEKTRPHFAALRELRDELSNDCDLPLPGLSMGMSHDFTVAIEEGATIVRVGSAIFGKR